MKTSPEGIALIKRFEGCRLKAYKDSVGVWTIGYGHTSMAGPPAVTPTLTLTQEAADAILITDLAKYEAAVTKALTRSPTANQFDAMVSLCFNIGPGNFAKSSVVRFFNAGDMDRAANSILLFRKAGGKVLNGLVSRRNAERELFIKPAVMTTNPPQEPPRPAVEAIPTAQEETRMTTTLSGYKTYIVAALVVALDTQARYSQPATAAIPMAR